MYIVVRSRATDKSYIALSISGLFPAVGGTARTGRRRQGGRVGQVSFAANAVEHGRTEAAESRRAVDARASVPAGVRRALVDDVQVAGVARRPGRAIAAEAADVAARKASSAVCTG